MKTTTPLLSTLLAGVLLTFSSAVDAQADGYKLVVNAANPETSMTASKASTLFLKRVSRWDSGQRVEPVDLTPRSSTRQSFSRDIHGKDISWVETYWNKMIFSGRASPPPEMNSEQDVLAFVRANPNAIGYVSAGTDVGAGVRVVDITQ